MIINGGSRSNWRFFSKHLMRADQNERVTVTEVRGLAAETVLDAFRELDALASGTRTKNFFYHANINPRAEEQLSDEQWERAIDELETNLGLVGQSRFIVEHEKEGRTHRHVIWSRIDPDSLTAISDSYNYLQHERTSRTLEAEFGHEVVQGVHERAPDVERPDRRPQEWETFRGQQSGLDPEAIKVELTQLWQQADSGQAFVAALEEHGYLLAKGDKRDFCVIDSAGDSHSLARRIDGARVKDIRERMADLDRDALPSVAEACEIMGMRCNEAASSEVTQPSADVADVSSGGNPFEDYRQTVAETMAANGGDLHPVPFEGDEVPQEAAPQLSFFQRFVRDFKEVMRSEAGHAPIHDGMTWWERAAMVAAPYVSYASERAVEAVSTRWQNLVDRYRSPGNIDPGPEHSAQLDRTNEGDMDMGI